MLSPSARRIIFLISRIKPGLDFTNPFFYIIENQIPKTNPYFMNIGNEFQSFAKDYGITGMNLHYHNQHVADTSGFINMPNASVTPMVVEDRPVQGTIISVFDRLMMDRIIWFAGPVTESSATITQAQLMFLESLGSEDITMYINSPGGGVYAGLSIVDVMDYIKADVATINVGMAASMGSVLLAKGAKGKRSCTRYSRTMLHQSSGGAGGNIQDARIMMAEWDRLNQELFQILGDCTGKTWEQVAQDASRDLWLKSDEALAYGIVDEIITK
jgi:ATP-dependent Clp protease protease subunit